MKIIEKNCPKCGATLNFHTKDKEAKCEYCNSEFIIENNEKEDVSKFDIENINLTRKIVTTFTIIPFIIAGIVMIVVIVSFISLFSIFHKQNNNHLDDNTPNNIIDINDIIPDSNEKDEINIEDLDETIKEKLANYSIKEAQKWQSLHDYKVQGNREPVGFYYLKNKSFNDIEVYAVIKSTYSNGKNKKTLYSAYVFRGDNLESISYNPFIASKTYKLSTYEMTYGYETLEELYDSDIRDNKSNHQIVATDNLYLE